MPNGNQSNLIINRKSDIQVMMYFDFHIANKYSVDSVAQKVGWHRDTLYKKINGTLPTTADDVIKISLATGSLAYVEFMAAKVGCSLIPQIKDKKCAEMMKAMALLLTSATNNGGEDKS